MPPSSGKSAIKVQARTGPTPGIDVSSRYRCASVASVTRGRLGAPQADKAGSRWRGQGLLLVRSNKQWSLRSLWGLLAQYLPQLLLIRSYHNPLLFRRTVEIRLQIASSILLGLIFLDLERIGCGPRVLAGSRHLPTDLHPALAARYLKAVLRNLLSNVQVWRSSANGGELVVKISI